MLYPVLLIHPWPGPSCSFWSLFPLSCWFLCHISMAAFPPYFRPPLSPTRSHSYIFSLSLSPIHPPSAYCSDLFSLSVRKAKQAGREWDLFSYPLHPVSPLPPLALLLVPWQVQHSIEINHLPRQIHMCVRELVRRVRAPSWWWCVFCCEHGPRTTTLLLPACVCVCVINASGCDLPTLLSAWFMLSPSTLHFHVLFLFI